MTKKELIEQGWAPIEGLPNHRITVDGRIQTRYIKNTFGLVGKEWYDMKPSTDRAGYPCQGLTHNGKHYSFSIHRIMAVAFIDNPAAKEDVNHIDGNKLNCDLSNLEWISHVDNMKHAAARKLMKPVFGSRNKLAKLNERQAYLIKRDLANGVIRRDLEIKYKISKTTIAKIAQGKGWAHVQYP